MKKYIAFEWPDIQEFMDNPKWGDVGFDPDKIKELFNNK